MRRRRILLLIVLLGLARALGATDAHADGADERQVRMEPYDHDVARLNPGQCRTLAKQIVRYNDVAAMAEERGDDLWEDHTRDRLDHLEYRWNALCGDPDDTTARMMWAAMKEAGQIALRYFTLGMY